MERLAMPIIRGLQVLLHMHHSLDVSAVLSRFISSERRGKATPWLNPQEVAGGVTATVEITLGKKLVIEHDVVSVVDHSPVGVGQQAQPRKGDGKGNGPGGTAMVEARGGTRQWRWGGCGNGD